MASMQPPPAPTAEQRSRSRRFQSRSASRSGSTPSYTPSQISSQLGKRKRAASKPPSVSHTTSFSSSTKAQVRADSSGYKYWHCGAEGLDIAQVKASCERNTSTPVFAKGQRTDSILDLSYFKSLRSYQPRRTTAERERITPMSLMPSTL